MAVLCQRIAHHQCVKRVALFLLRVYVVCCRSTNENTRRFEGGGCVELEKGRTIPVAIRLEAILESRGEAIEGDRVADANVVVSLHRVDK